MFSLSVFGHTTLDFIVELEKLPEPNTSIEMEHQKRFFGGTGANIARRASRLGVKTMLSSLVGNDFPEDFRRALEEDNVLLPDFRVVDGYLTPMCWILSDREHNQIAVINQGPMRDADMFDIPLWSIENSTMVHISTGRPGYYMRIMEHARSLGKKIGFDPSQEIHYVYSPETFLKMLSLSDIFFSNNSEMNRALQYAGEKNVEGLLAHVPMVVLTLGSKGSRIYASGEDIDIPPIAPNRIKDTTGAGDAYRAGFYAGMSRGLGNYECGLYGSASASFALEEFGPQNSIPTHTDLEERLSASR